jgi:transposase
MKHQPPIDQPLWDGLPAEARAAVTALVDFYERRIAELEQRLGRNSTNSSKPPSSDPPHSSGGVHRPLPRARSGAGSPDTADTSAPWSPPEQLRQVVECRPPSCRWCGDALVGDDPEPIRHQVAEVPPIRPAVDEYRLHRLKCPRCRATTCAEPPPGLPTGTFGPRLRAILGVLAGAYRLGKRPIRQLASDLLGLSISAGMICRLERQGAAELEAPVGGLRGHVRTASSAHIDETSWRQGRDKMWLWAAVTKGATVFTIAKSRGAEVARGLLGTDRRKVVISGLPHGWRAPR